MPEPKPAPSKPKTRAPVAARPLTAERSLAPNQYAMPQGAEDGTVIGGGGEGGGGSGCGGAGYYLSMITSQLRVAFTRNEKTDARTFHVRARIWFDGAGRLQQAQLVQSTGDSNLDMTVRRLFDAVNVGGGMPQCLQPVTVWVGEPWDVWLGGVTETQSYRTEQGPGQMR
jgi:hypothetical protein